IISLSVIPFIMSIYIGIKQYQRTKQLGVVYFIVSCIFFCVSIVVWGISAAVNDPSIVISLAPPIGACSAVTIVLHADAISKDTADPVKLIVVAILATGAAVSAFLMFSVFIAFIVSLQVFSLAVWIYYAQKIHAKAPSSIKKWSRLNFAGVLVFAGGSLWGSTGLVPNIPASLLPLIDAFRWEAILGIGYIMIALAYFKAPNLANVLPFVAIRLSIIDIKAGIALFNHDWARRDDLIHEDLFSSMLSGISMILKESVRKGDIREIVLDKARLLLKRSEEHSIAFVLITSHPTKTLRNALEVFAARFIIRFADDLAKHGTDIEIGKFLPARELVRDCFPFAVEYTENGNLENKASRTIP
ncbi:MAG: hypothetical protein Q6353_004585, partial [Candidatus Sigynarchaeum springense]